MQNWRKPIYMLLTLCMLFSFGMQLPVGAAVQSGAVKASTETTDNPVDYAVDSDTSTAWMCDTIDADIWFWMDLGSVQEIAGVDLNLYNNDYIESYTIEVSQDENSWTQVAERYTPGQMESETFDEIEARYLRWSAIMDDECTDSIGLYEIIVQEAKKPEPTPTASAAPSQTPSSNQFQDIPADVSGTQYEEAIYNLMSVGVISGYLDGTYRPDNTMTRAEFAVVAVRAMGYDDILPQQTQSLFYDVPSTHWAAPSIELLTQMGYLDGYGDRMFGPDDDITYGQVIKISPTSTNYINPMDLNLDYSDDESPLSLKSDFILSLCELIVGGKDGLQPVQKTIIDRCVRLVYQDYLNDPRPENMPILEDLYDAEIRKVKNAYAAVTAQAKLKREEQARQSNRQEIVHSIAEADALTSELTDLLIEKVYVFPDNRIEIVYKVHDLFE